jgi:NAD(P)-dependent dehydrogenase (short-subunit alcohol dehydrogenase family)
MTMKEHLGRVAIVTGASSGIGRATAVKLATAGARVLAIGRNRARLDELVREAPGITPLKKALETPHACLEAVEAARALGPPVLLVNAAGIGGHMDQPIFEQSSEAWRQTMAINLDAPFELTRLVARDIREQGFGRIVMVSSTAGEIGAPSMSPYCASKHGLIGLMRSVAQDVAPFNATCNAVLPSWVRTEMAEDDARVEARRRGMTVEAIWEERTAQNPAKRILSPEEVADVVLYLLSNAARGVNGEAMTVSIGAMW